MKYVMTPDECRRAYRFPSNQRNFETFEAFARAMSVDLEAAPPAQPQPSPPPAVSAKAPESPKPKPDPMAGEFARFMARRKAENPTEETPDMSNKQPSGDAEARRKWDSDPQLRAEFGEDFQRYRAYARAVHEGKAKVMNGGRSYGR